MLSDTVFDQNGGDTMRKSCTTPRVTWESVSDIGRPSPSSRGTVWKYSHQGWSSSAVSANADGVARMSAHLPVPVYAARAVRVDGEVVACDDEPGGLVLRVPASVYVRH